MQCHQSFILKEDNYVFSSSGKLKVHKYIKYKSTVLSSPDLYICFELTTSKVNRRHRFGRHPSTEKKDVWIKTALHSVTNSTLAT